jgi:trehalose 6-phosphate synthase
MRFEREEFDIYRKVNARFAASLAKLLRPNDLVWVHDFHLIPLAEELRRLGVASASAFSCTRPSRRPRSWGRCPRTRR